MPNQARNARAVRPDSPQPAEDDYRPLPPGTSGLSRAEVEADRRWRLQRAMVETVARLGYPATTVKDVVGLAHISRTTFYQHFESMQDCMLQTHDQIVRDSSERVAKAYRSKAGWDERLRTAFDEFFAVVVSDPDAAKLVVGEAFAVAEDGTEYRERAAASFELLLRQSFDQAPGGGRVSDTTLRALVGGIRRLVYIHLHDGTVAELPALAGDISGWVLSYLLPANAGAAAPADPAPAGPPAPGQRPSHPALELPGSRLHYNSRERIMRAIETLVAERGYRALTFETIAARAGTSNQTFYEEFSNKQGAFLAVFDDGAKRALGATQRAFEREVDWPQAACAGIAALLGFLADEPDFARLAFVELFAAGEVAHQRFKSTLEWFASTLAPGLELAPNISPTVITAISGGAWTIIHREVSHRRTVHLAQLTPSVCYIMLAPFIGAEDAARIAAERMRAPAA